MRLFPRWFSKGKADQDWLAIVAGESDFRFAVGRITPGGGAAVSRFGAHAIEKADASIERLIDEQGLKLHRCETVLSPGEYQLLQVEAPNVPADELKSAIRWSIKDMLDYHIDDAMIDVLDIPGEGPASARSHPMYAVAAKNDLIEGRIRRFEALDLPLTVIDIPETAQRNIAALYESHERGIAFLYMDSESSLLTINYRAELYLARRVDVGLQHIRQAEEGAREDLFGRLLLELQRTLDHFERQFPYVSLGTLVLGPEPEDCGLLDVLSRNLDVSIIRADLADRIAFPAGNRPSAEDQWRLFHLIGATMRHEAKVL